MVIISDLILTSSAGRGSTGLSLAAQLLTLGGLQCSSWWLSYLDFNHIFNHISYVVMLNWFWTHFLIAGRAYSWRLRLQRIAHSFPLPRSNLPSLHTGSKYIIFWTLCISMYSLFSQNNQAWLERNQEKFGSRQVIQYFIEISIVQWLIIII